MSTLTAPITAQDVIASRDLIGFSPDKFAQLVDYVEQLERELEFSKFEANRHRVFETALLELLWPSLKFSLLVEMVTAKENAVLNRFIQEWNTSFLDSFERLNKEVESGNVDSERFEELKEKLHQILERLHSEVGQYIAESETRANNA